MKIIVIILDYIFIGTIVASAWEKDRVNPSQNRLFNKTAFARKVSS